MKTKLSFCHPLLTKTLLMHQNLMNIDLGCLTTPFIHGIITYIISSKSIFYCLLY